MTAPLTTLEAVLHLLKHDVAVSRLLYMDMEWRGRLSYRGKTIHGNYAFADGCLIQLVYWEPDVEDENEPAVLQACREWWVPFPSEPKAVVRTAYKALQTSLEHRLGEHFRYRGVRVYNPHRELEAPAPGYVHAEGLSWADWQLEPASPPAPEVVAVPQGAAPELTLTAFPSSEEPHRVASSSELYVCHALQRLGLLEWHHNGWRRTAAGDAALVRAQARAL